MFQVILFFFSFCLNLYLVCCFLFDADLRQLRNYPIFLLNFTDLLATGPGFFSLLVSQQFIQPHTDFNFDGQDTFVSWISHIRDFFRPHVYSLIVSNVSWFWYICLPELLTQRLNEYSNGPCTLLIAYERYVMVCKPHQKDQILTEKRRYKMYATVTLTIIFMLFLDAFIRYTSYDFHCSSGFIFDQFDQSRTISSTVTCLIFSILPTVFSTLFYYRAATALIKRKKKIGRNLNLIVCFAMICSVSLLTLSVRYTFNVYLIFVAKKELPRKIYQYPFVRNLHLRFILNNFSGFAAVFNPFLILLGQTDYREPFFKHKKKMIQKFNFLKMQNYM